MDPVRAEALRRLQRIERDGAYTSLVEGGAGQTARAERKIADYLNGVTRWRRWLDFLIDHFYTGKKLAPKLRHILRLGLYDLLLTQTPPHAAIYETVQLAKKKVRPAVGGLVNGILRNVERQQNQLPVPKGNLVVQQGVQYSHPDWLVARWHTQFGTEETEILLHHNNARPRFALRINALKTTPGIFHDQLRAQEIAFEPSPYLTDFVRVSALQPILQTDWVKTGQCAVQDESAGLVVHLLDPQPQETIIDACAAPGGKAIYAALRMKNQGRILAMDVHPQRLDLVAQSAGRQGVTILQTHQANGTQSDQWPEVQADAVLVDAPCSGLGTLSKRADLRWHRKPEDLETLCVLQDALLDQAAQHVRVGGRLVYSTCTIEPEENAARIHAFLARHPQFQIEPAGTWVPKTVVDDTGFLATFPHRHGVDGAFAARLRRLS